jgi:hypothetical protein
VFSSLVVVLCFEFLFRAFFALLVCFNVLVELSLFFFVWFYKDHLFIEKKNPDKPIVSVHYHCRFDQSLLFFYAPLDI